jgi:hypothetical protein
MKKFSIIAALMVVAAGAALANTLNVPFFLDTTTGTATGVSGFIGLKEASGTNQTVTVVYTALNNSGNPTNQVVTFALGASQALSWTPVQSTSIEGVGSIVPNMNAIPNAATPAPTTGSATIIGVGTLVGRYQQINYNRFTEFAHTILPTAL